jgi:hypothetical protein
MYQAGRHGTAIGFLKDACALGVKALGMWKKMPGVDKKEDRNEKAEDGWHQLEDQLYRRWELLGVCYSKIGDRKVGVVVLIFICQLIAFLYVSKRLRRSWNVLRRSRI